jgi:glycosyltransferase involved in cell wall biosynthesis
MQKTTPITLLLPIRNGQNFVAGAISSLSSNCRPEDEILIINDNSTDNSLALLRNWSERNSNVRILNNPGRGLVSALNYGLSVATFDWIARFDVDDKYDSNRLMETKKYIQRDTVCIFSDYKFTTKDGRSLGYMPTAIDENRTYLSLITSQRTAHPSVCFNKTAAIEVGGYIEEDFPAEDLSLWLRMSKCGKIISIPNPFLKYRISSSSVSGNLRYKSLEKKELLLSSFNFLPGAVEKGLAELEESRIFYSNFTYSQHRYLLHLRDLALICHAMSSPDSSALKLIKHKIYREFNNYPPAASLYTQMLLRKIYRKL